MKVLYKLVDDWIELDLIEILQLAYRGEIDNLPDELLIKTHNFPNVVITVTCREGAIEAKRAFRDFHVRTSSCAICDFTAVLDLHHVFPNGNTVIRLCPNHHAMIHREVEL